MMTVPHNALGETVAGGERRLRIVAVGGAGSNILDRGTLDGLGKSNLVAVNTDVQALSASVAGQKLQIGRGITRGLGAGGDPELGLAAAEDAVNDFREMIAGMEMVFLCVGLGGGTGSGAAPLLARVAREAGALVIAFVTLPFAFEGRRRGAQAAEALAELGAAADAVVTFENDRMGEVADARSGIHEAFHNADRLVSQSIRAIVDFTFRPALMRVGVPELVEVLRGHEARCLFGCGEGEGTSAVHDALTGALKSPLMDRGRLLAQSGSVLVQVTGGQSMSYAEVQALMTALGKHIHADARVFLGVAVDPALEKRIRLTVIAVGGRRVDAPDGQAERPAAQPASRADVGGSRLSGGADPGDGLDVPPTTVDAAAAESDAGHPDGPPLPLSLPAEGGDPGVASGRPPGGDDLFQDTRTADDPADTPSSSGGSGGSARSRPDVPPAPAPDPKANPKTPGKKPAVQQADFQFEPVSRGRFDKIEPTIVDGEDLDVPTFMRKNVRL